MTEPRRLTIEYEGGPYNGMTETATQLPDTLDMLDPPLVAAAGEPYPEISYRGLITYRRSWDRNTGGQRRTAGGAYIYRAGPHRLTWPELPEWLWKAFPDGYAWQATALGRWHAKQANYVDTLTGDVIHWHWLFVACVVKPNGEMFYKAVQVTQESMKRAAADMRAMAEDELDRWSEHTLLPPCDVPDCTDKGRNIVHPLVDGRFASRQWKAGAEIRLCPRHMTDVLRAAHSMYDELPEWLRVDANPMHDAYAYRHAIPIREVPESIAAFLNSGPGKGADSGTQPRSGAS